MDKEDDQRPAGRPKRKPLFWFGHRVHAAAALPHEAAALRTGRRDNRLNHPRLCLCRFNARFFSECAILASTAISLEISL
jgi:hypothetical protein